MSNAADPSASSEVGDGGDAFRKETGVTTAVHASGHVEDTKEQIKIEKEDAAKDTSSSRSISPSSQARRPEHDRTVLSFAEHDREDPYNFSAALKIYIVCTGILMVLNSTIGSSLPSGATEATQEHFQLTEQWQLVLPISIYLIGYVVGPLVFSPLSETYGRKIVMISTFVVFTAFTLGCALAPNYAALIVFRLMVGVGASTPVSVIGGIYSDIYKGSRERGLVITIFMAATTWGPVAGPILSGYTSPYSWRWPYWAGLMVTSVTWPALLFMPETYHPVLLERRAKKLRKKTGDQSIVAPSELEERTLKQLFNDVLTRPLRMLFFEGIVLCTCLYLGVAYAIFYMCFQSFPIIYEQTYGFSAGEMGLAFLPIGIGAIIACSLYLVWDSHLRRVRARVPPPAWSQIEEYVRLPLACLGGPLFVISLFWLGWTANKNIHWIVPTLSALPFGVGFLLVFMGQLNYMVDSYSAYAASAMGAAATSRSVFGVVLPFAARPMYYRLGVSWATTLLGFISLAMTLVPFVFIRYGDRIRANSSMCQELRRQQEAEEGEEQRRRMGEKIPQTSESV